MPKNYGKKALTNTKDESDINELNNQMQAASLSPRKLLSYKYTNKKKSEQKELFFQQQTNDRFFRFNKPVKKNVAADKLLNKIKKILINKEEEKINDSILLDEHQIEVVRFYLKNAVDITGLSSRSIIIALAKILNEKKFIPTLVFKIGCNHILCTSNPKQQLGNVNVQAIDAKGRIVFIPSVYGDGNGNPSCSIAHRLNSIIKKNRPKKIFQALHTGSHKIVSSTTQKLNLTSKDAQFLDQLNFLRSIIENARRGYRGKDNPTKELDALPIGIAQARTSELLIKGLITSNDAYGLDIKGKFYKQPVKQKSCRAPYGAVTGQDLRNNVEEVKEKIKRINNKYNKIANDKYNKMHHPTNEFFIIEGRNKLRKKLGEEYGSADESSGDDYSDSDSPTLNKCRRS